jgi:hypothetical protein
MIQFRRRLCDGRCSLPQRVGLIAIAQLWIRLISSIENAVSSFFTPASKKPPEKIVWQERGINDDSPATLIVGKYMPSVNPGSDDSSEHLRTKVAAFDFVGSPASFGRDERYSYLDNRTPHSLKLLQARSSLLIAPTGSSGTHQCQQDSKSCIEKMGTLHPFIMFTMLNMSQVQSCSNQQPGRNITEARYQSAESASIKVCCVQS